MKLYLANHSIVIIGQEYTPGRLTPDFLRSVQIAKKNWELLDTPVITPVISLVKYSNGLTFLNDPTKIQIQDETPQQNPAKYRVSEIATKYVKEVGKYRYTAVGINITGIIDHPNYEKYVKDHFINSGVWKDENLTMAVVRLTYKFDDFVLNLTLDQGRAQTQNEEFKPDGIIINANYHTDIPANISIEQSHKRVRDAILVFGERYSHFLEMAHKLFDLEK